MKSQPLKLNLGWSQNSIFPAELVYRVCGFAAAASPFGEAKLYEPLPKDANLSARVMQLAAQYLTPEDEADIAATHALYSYINLVEACSSNHDDPTIFDDYLPPDCSLLEFMADVLFHRHKACLPVIDHHSVTGRIPLERLRYYVENPKAKDTLAWKNRDLRQPWTRKANDPNYRCPWCNGNMYAEYEYGHGQVQPARCDCCGAHEYRQIIVKPDLPDEWPEREPAAYPNPRAEPDVQPLTLPAAEATDRLAKLKAVVAFLTNPVVLTCGLATSTPNGTPTFRFVLGDVGGHVRGEPVPYQFELNNWEFGVPTIKMARKRERVVQIGYAPQHRDATLWRQTPETQAAAWEALKTFVLAMGGTVVPFEETQS